MDDDDKPQQAQKVQQVFRPFVLVLMVGVVVALQLQLYIVTMPGPRTPQKGSNQTHQFSEENPLTSQRPASSGELCNAIEVLLDDDRLSQGQISTLLALVQSIPDDQALRNQFCIVAYATLSDEQRNFALPLVTPQGKFTLSSISHGRDWFQQAVTVAERVAGDGPREQGSSTAEYGTVLPSQFTPIMLARSIVLLGTDMKNPKLALSRSQAAKILPYIKADVDAVDGFYQSEKKILSVLTEDQIAVFAHIKLNLTRADTLVTELQAALRP